MRQGTGEVRLDPTARFSASAQSIGRLDRILRPHCGLPLANIPKTKKRFWPHNHRESGECRFKFNEAISFQIPVETQAEADRFADALSAVPEAEQCGWVKDRFGVSWQIVPRQL
jgi:hypothetical protein